MHHNPKSRAKRSLPSIAKSIRNLRNRLNILQAEAAVAEINKHEWEYREALRDAMRLLEVVTSNVERGEKLVEAVEWKR